MTLCIVPLIGCGKKTDETAPAADPATKPLPATPTSPPPSAGKLEPLPFESGKLPAGVAIAGTVSAGLHWRDADGEAFLVLSSEREEADDTQTEKLHAVVIAMDATGAASVRWSAHAAVEACEFDVIARFRDEAMSLTDLDADGHAEVTVAYETACTSDVSPNDLTLYVVEGAEAHGLKGETIVDPGGGETFGGTMTADASFAAAPALQAHAAAAWKKIVGP